MLVVATEDVVTCACGSNDAAWYMSWCSMYFYDMSWFQVVTTDDVVTSWCGGKQNRFQLQDSSGVPRYLLSYCVFSYDVISYDTCYQIQSETYSLVTRTPPFAAPKLYVAEVDRVMLSSLPDKRYQHSVVFIAEQSCLCPQYVLQILPNSEISFEISLDFSSEFPFSFLWDYLWDFLWDFIWDLLWVSPTEQSCLHVYRCSG